MRDSLVFHCVLLTRFLIGNFTTFVYSFARNITHSLEVGVPVGRGPRSGNLTFIIQGYVLGWGTLLASWPPKVKKQQALVGALAIIIKWKLCLEPVPTQIGSGRQC